MSTVLDNVRAAVGRSDLAGAIQILQEAISDCPQDPTYPNELAAILAHVGRLKEAAGVLERAVPYNPEDLGLLSNLALAHIHLGNSSAAVPLLRRAVALAPDSGDLQAKLGTTLYDTGEYGAASDAFCAAIEGGLESEAVWFQLAQALNQISFREQNQSVRRWLLRLADHPGIPVSLLFGPIANYLQTDELFHQALLRARHPDFELGDQLAILSDPLFVALLRRGCSPNPILERLVTGARRRLLLQASEREIHQDLLCAVAQSALASEYAWAESEPETIAIERLSHSLATGQARNPDIAIYCAYRPLHRAPWVKGLPQQGWMPPYEALIRAALLEPLLEQEIARSIPCLAMADDSASQRVRAQYENSPYPRWRDMVRALPESAPQTIRRLHPHVSLARLSWPEKPEILIAGCGTGRHAIETAQRHPQGRILAVDLSRASLAYGARKARELGLKNIEFAQADILALPSLGRAFDAIEASGVLHHMADPKAAWRGLVSILKPGGLMTVALYSRIARRALFAERDRFGTGTDEPSAEAIRRFRARVLDATEDSPLLSFRDFYSLSECRDLLFHAQETDFTLEEIGAALTEMSLDFVGMGLPPQLLDAYRQRFPEDPTCADLALWAAFEAENPSIFRGMYQFWAIKRGEHA